MIKYQLNLHNTYSIYEKIQECEQAYGLSHEHEHFVYVYDERQFVLIKTFGPENMTA